MKVVRAAPAGDVAVKGDHRLRLLAVVCAMAAFPALLLSLRPAAPALPVITDEDGRQIITSRTDGPTVGMDAPGFELETFDGAAVRMEDLRGRIVVVNFFASWCPTCEFELAQLSALKAVISSYGDIVAVAVRDERDAAEALIDSVGGRELIDAGMDPDGAIARDYLVLGAPGTMVVGPDGRIAGDWRGPVDMRFLFNFIQENFPEIASGRPA